ncbi:family 10 glycosylhydrolase [Massilia endophytica]|uniref:family 10 glycosylhydrolase n=1 Tax=Massilia endophytica TaxID=2899220 RepID=UPI001E5546CC|nr:family 10 glycosylhydrolase [Massilia endophytica]UGQ44845.1 family 10 glycosylhydrolase [Massilia endophytica]
MKRLLCAVAALCVFAAGQPQAQTTAPKREMRGVWISTHIGLDWPVRTQTPAQQRAALTAILDHNKATGMNAAYFQVRSQADAMFPSTLEPWSYYLTNSSGTAPSPAWDPLQFALEETRKRGLEFHAWINPYRAVATLSNAGNTAMYGPTHVSRTHPEWLLTIGTVQILNPGLPAVRDHVHAVVMDIVQRYDVDGIHFDDYFYPNGTPATIDDAAYNADPRGFPNTAAGRADWRRDNINLLISRVGESIAAAKPWVKFGISPSGIYRSSTDPAVGSPTSAGALQHYSAMFADSRKWLQMGWIDYLAPQVYWYIGQTGSDYQLLVPWWNENAFGRHMYIGLADYKMNTAGWTSPAQIANQIAMNRGSSHIAGQIHFRHAFLQANALGYRTDLKDNIYNKPALLPAMPWKDSTVPSAANELSSVLNGDGSLTLSWSRAEGADEFDKARRYAIYRSEQPNIDLEDRNNLLALTSGGETTYTDSAIPAGKYYYYAVTALNRLHHESAASNTASNDKEAPVVRTRAIERTLVGGNVSIAADEVDNGSTDNWGIESRVLSKNSFSCSNIGDNQVELSVTDKAGNVGTAPAIVKVLGAIPQPQIAVSRTDSTATGAPANTIVLGYGAQSLTLTASDGASGSVSAYAWSPAEGLSTATGAVTQFTPAAAGTYSFTVQATNQNACSAAGSVTIPVIDARCGGDKVKVCKKSGGTSHEICVAPSAVPAHLKKDGGVLGSCGA